LYKLANCEGSDYPHYSSAAEGSGSGFIRVRDWRQARRVRGSLPISIGQDLVLSTMALLVLELSLVL
jgi:hypothetical protein